jgi:acetyl-CoA carboxylase biotin carboxyl carrier protein
MKIDTNAIKELAEILDDTGLTEIEVAEGDKMIRINRGGTTYAAHSAAPVHMPSDPTVPQPASNDMPIADVSTHPGAVSSPMVGTVYLAPEPSAADFITKGGSIKEGDTLMIIEAMKVMNPIKAPKSGTITQILIENEQPVEFGDVLVVIE